MTSPASPHKSGSAQVLMTASPPPPLLKRRPLLVAQESAEASPREVDLSRKRYASPVSPIAEVRAKITWKTRLENFLGVEDGSALDRSILGEEVVEEEGLSKIARSTLKLETLLWYGVLLCFDQILTLMIIVPLRAVYTVATKRTSSSKHFVFDVACLSIFLVSLICLANFVGAAQVYHSIRLQTFMKLYVVVNIAEVLDRLLSSLGLDLFELLADASRPGKRLGMSFVIRYMLCLGYTCLHGVLFYVRLLTLSVAINSSNDALFTILVSNNFVELKGSVFKRSSEQNLFQIACSDVVERFVLICFMLLVGLNEFETRRQANEGEGAFLALMLLVLVTEIIVDWIKHMFIARFNSDIKVKDVYDRFLGVLADDFSGKNSSLQVEDDNKQSRNAFPAVARRLGLPIVPLTMLIVRVFVFDVSDVMQERTWLFIIKGWLVGLGLKIAVRLALTLWNALVKDQSLLSAAEDDDDDDHDSSSIGERDREVYVDISSSPMTPMQPATALPKPPPISIDKAPLATPARDRTASVNNNIGSQQQQQQGSPGKSASKKSADKSLLKVSRFESA